MKRALLVDTAEIEAIRHMMTTDAISGVTTNPSLISKEKNTSYIGHLREIVEIIEDSPTTLSGERKHLSVEVTSLDCDKMIEESRVLAQNLSSPRINLFVKIPVSINNLSVITELTKMGISVNATACMTYTQAKLSADAGAKIVSFFFNRMFDMEKCPKTQMTRDLALQNISKFSTLERYSRDRWTPQVICGSIRSTTDVIDCWTNGADYVTASPKIIVDLCRHPATDQAIDEFTRAFEEWRR